MAEVILMPRLSDTMTEGVIASWHKKIGESVKKGDLLAEIETDKATMELESYQNGTLLHIGTPNGGKLQVNDLQAGTSKWVMLLKKGKYWLILKRIKPLWNWRVTRMVFYYTRVLRPVQ